MYTYILTRIILNKINNKKLIYRIDGVQNICSFYQAEKLAYDFFKKMLKRIVHAICINQIQVFSNNTQMTQNSFIFWCPAPALMHTVSDRHFARLK